MSRLSWFPFYVDDWQGGTSSFLSLEIVAYLQALLEQWSSKDLQAIPDNPEVLKAICRGGEFTNRVRAKFRSVEVNGEVMLRNERLAREWARAKSEHEGRVKGGRVRAERAAELDGQQVAEMDTEHSPLPPLPPTPPI